jgi:uncharacterized membrane protein YvbJ
MKIRKMSAFVSALIALTLVVTACNKAGSSPTATAKAFFDAVKSKDVQGMKNTMSKNSLKIIEDMAKTRNKSLDDFLKQGPPKPPPETFESKEETIAPDGNTATLKVKGDGDKYDTFQFVKEDGQWKIAFDKMND